MQMVAVWHRWLRSVWSVRVATPLLILFVSVGGLVYVKHVVDAERRAAADQHAVTDAQSIQGQLEQAGNFETGLSYALAGERAPEALRFQAMIGAGASGGLADVMWVQRVIASERQAYEARFGVISRPLRGLIAGPAPVYFPATFVVGLPYAQRADMAEVGVLANTLRNPTSVFAGTATAEAAVAGERGFFLVQGAQFGRGPWSQGLLVVFVPAGWLSKALTGPSDGVALSLDGQRLAGTTGDLPVATQSFEALTQQWLVDVAEAPATPLQAALPLLALAWPLATALIVFLIGRAILRRRRAEREVDDIFGLSADLLCTLGADGYLKRVNPAFEHTLGYDAGKLLTRPLLSFVHPDDREPTTMSLASLREGNTAESFESRFVCADATVRWLQWNARSPLQRGLIYAAAHDVTDTRALLQEQAALRRVATLVAEGADANDVFTAVAIEVRQLLGADATSLVRYEPGGAAVVVAADAAAGADIGTTTGVDGSADPPGDGLASGARAEVTAPIIVSARLWGMIVAAWDQPGAAHPDLDTRLGHFTELVATACANAENRALLSASRRRIVATADETRRRIERDLHDGAQHRLVSTALKLKLAEQAFGDGPDDAAQLVREALENTESAIEELRELARGIHPAILSSGGLAPAIKALARRSPIPVVLDVRTDARLPEGTEATAYFVISEALTNAARHSDASQVTVTVDAVEGVARLSVDDDGVGGASPANGSGLVGLRDRVEAVGGTLTLHSPSGEGTHLTVDLPLSPN